MILKICKKICKKICTTIGIFSKSDWVYSIDKYPLNNKWARIPKKESRILSGQEEKIILKTTRIIRKGWYLFGILHTDNNKFCFGSIRSGKRGIAQSRPMYPARRRWRVIRIKNNEEAFLELENISDDLVINEIWLVPLLNFFALKKIKKRIHSTTGIRYSSLKNYSYGKSWLIYNRVLLSQRNKSRTSNYLRWQEETEKRSLEKILFLKQKYKLPKLTFDVQENNNLNFVKNESFVIIKKSKDELSKNALDIFSITLAFNKNCLVLYPDEDCINTSGKRHSPNFKTAWNRELFWTDPSYSNCWVVEKKLWNKALRKIKKAKSKLNIMTLMLEIIKIKRVQ